MSSAVALSIPLLRRLRESGWRELLLWLLVMAMVMRAVIPVGFMPIIGQGANGFITICSGSGLLQIPAADADGRQTEPPATVKPGHDCVLCAAPVQSVGSGFIQAIFAVFFAVLALHGVIWLGLKQHRHNASAAPRAPPTAA